MKKENENILKKQKEINDRFIPKKWLLDNFEAKL